MTMVKVKSIILVSLFFYILCSCSSNQNKSVQKIKCTISLYDSIIFNEPGLIITDYNNTNNLFLGYNRYNYSISLFDSIGTKAYHFLHRGEGPSEYNYIHFWSIKFFSDTSICLIDGNTLKIFSIRGDFFKSIEFDPIKSPIKIRDFDLINKNEKMIFRRNDPSYVGDKNVYEDKLFRIFDFRKKQLRDIINFEKNSIYKNDDYFFTKVSPLFDINKSDKTFDILFPLEPIIYKYDLENFTLKNKVFLNPEHFSNNIQGINFGSKIKNSFYYEQINPAYEYFIVNNGITYIIYKEALREDKIFKSAADYNMNTEKIPKFLQIVFDKGEISNDIKLPSSRVGFISAIVPNSFILFYKKPNVFDETNNVTTFLKAKVIYEN